MNTEIGQKQIAAFFDLDLTITNRDSFRHFLKKQYLHNFYNWRFVPQLVFWGVLRKARVISLQVFKEKALVCLKGKDKIFIRQVGQDFFEKYLSEIVRKKALKRIGWHKEKGHYTFIISSCPDIYIHPLTEQLGCDGYECSRLFYDNTRFLGKLEGKDCVGTEKAHRLKLLVENEGLDLANSYAYSDHESDIPLLELVGNSTAVSPTDKLRKVAVYRGWTVEEW